MDYFLLIIGFLFVIGGVIGSFLPVIPGPLTGWLGLVCLHMTDVIPTNWNFLFIALGIAFLVTIADYVIPIISTKKYGGTKYGIWGSTIGLLFGLFLGPIGIILGPFVGALVGEMISDSTDPKKAFRAALGSLIGFLFSTGIKFVVGVYFVVEYVSTFMDYRTDFF